MSQKVVLVAAFEHSIPPTLLKKQCLRTCSTNLFQHYQTSGCACRQVPLWAKLPPLDSREWFFVAIGAVSRCVIACCGDRRRESAWHERQRDPSTLLKHAPQVRTPSTSRQWSQHATVRTTCNMPFVTRALGCLCHQRFCTPAPHSSPATSLAHAHV